MLSLTLLLFTTNIHAGHAILNNNKHYQYDRSHQTFYGDIIYDDEEIGGKRIFISLMALTQQFINDALTGSKQIMRHSFNDKMEEYLSNIPLLPDKYEADLQNAANVYILEPALHFYERTVEAAYNFAKRDIGWKKFHLLESDIPLFKHEASESGKITNNMIVRKSLDQAILFMNYKVGEEFDKNYIKATQNVKRLTEEVHKIMHKFPGLAVSEDTVDKYMQNAMLFLFANVKIGAHHILDHLKRSIMYQYEVEYDAAKFNIIPKGIKYKALLEENMEYLKSWKENEPKRYLALKKEVERMQKKMDPKKLRLLKDELIAKKEMRLEAESRRKERKKIERKSF